MPKLEYRSALELRADGRTLFGLAAPYGGPGAKIGSFTERIAPGAFTRALREQSDVMLLRDHDQHQLLARTSNGSLKLDDMGDGLHFRATLAEFTLADDTLAQTRSGLLAGMSIGFYIRGEQWSGDRSQRTLQDIELIEISAVGPAVAYPATSVQARHRIKDADNVSIHRARRRLILAGL